jgi:hypothetical protein
MAPRRRGSIRRASRPLAPPAGRSRAARAGSALALGLALAACAGPARRIDVGLRAFQFERDTIAYPNELVWEYEPDEGGAWQGRSRVPTPDYARYCFVVARTARQFFGHARFDPGLPVADDESYRRLIRRVVDSSPGRDLPDAQRIVVPGYASLREFSREREALLKREAGGWWQSYTQRGNWRMVLPFPRRHQAGQAERLLAAVESNRPPVVHLARFPRITINHAVILYDSSQTEAEIRFQAYDPNHPDAPRTLRFDRASRTFLFPRTNYFPGGRVDVYQIYHAPFY